MFGFSPKLPISEEDRQWVNEGFRRLEKLLGRRRMLDARVIAPTAEDFPDPYDKTTEAAEKLFSRVCDYMNVDRNEIEFEIFPDETEALKAILPHWSGSAGKRAAGLYIHAMEERSSGDSDNRRQAVVAIRSSQLKDPLALVATMAHELGHVILLGGGLMNPKPSDHEPLTDLLTVFLGLGIFTANSAGRFKQFRKIGAWVGPCSGWAILPKKSSPTPLLSLFSNETRKESSGKSICRLTLRPISNVRAHGWRRILSLWRRPNRSANAEYAEPLPLLSRIQEYHGRATA
jgi:hypothetical protein